MQLLQKQDLHPQSLQAEKTSSDFIDLDAVFAIIARQWRTVGICALAAILLGLGYIFTAVPQYTAAVRLFIDRNSGSPIVEQLAAVGAMVDEEGSILSQVEVLKSKTIALAVVDKLQLVNDPAFNSRKGSPISAVIGGIKAVLNVPRWFASGDKDEVSDEVARNAAAERLMDDISINRVGRTYVLELGYTSPSAELAAKVANTLASEYLNDKLNAKFEATRRASEWLSTRISELRTQALQSDLAVQKFRAEHNLIKVGDNALISDQKLSQLNNALITAQSDVAQAQARLQRIQQILNADDVDAVVTDVLDSPVANELRKKYLEASKVEAEISARLGDRHVQAIRLRNEMQEYKRLMFEEVNRIAQSYKSDLQVAQARVDALQQSVDDASGVTVDAGQTQVQLRELEREADTYKNLYQTFLQRYQEAVQQQSFPITEARIISSARPPDRASKPVKALVLAIFLFAGLGVGSAIGGYREFRDRFFRTGDQIRDILGLEFLGNVNAIEAGAAASSRTDTDYDKSRSVIKASNITDYVIDHPLSSMAETMRSIRLAVDLSLPNKVSKIVGIVSTLPGEGKSTVAANFAEMLAMQGVRTVLVDADIRNPGSTRALGRHAKAGLIEIIVEGRDYREVLLTNPATDLAFIPTVIKQRVPHSSELLMSGAMRKLLSDLSAIYDYVVVDLPPLGPVIDARAINDRIDGFVLVVEWGNTSRHMVKSTLLNEPAIRQKCVGAVLNRVDLEKLKLYRTYGSSDYYYSRYHGYYQDEK